MSVLRTLLARWKAFFGGNRTDRLAEELALHADLLADDYRKRGMSEVEARYAAARELGNRTSLAGEYRQQSGIPVLETFWQDLRYAIRSLRRNPVFAASSLTTLAVGLSGMITVLCVVSSFLWTPLPYPEHARLQVLKQTDPRGGLWQFSEPALLDLEQRVRSLDSVSAYARGNSALTGAGEPEMIQSAAVTPSFIPMFGMRMLAGRTELLHGTAVISRSLWKRKWQMLPSIVGQAIRVDGANYVISGVADAPVDLLPGVELLLPLEPKPEASRSAHEIDVVGRARKGFERQVQPELNALGFEIAREHPGNQTGWGMRAIPLTSYLTGARTTRTLWMILAGVGLVWLLACSNVAELQLARRIARRQEIETRMALGASGRRMLAQSLIESFVLALAGTVLGLGMADWAVHLLASLAPDSLPRLARVHLDARTLAAAAGCLIISTLIFGIFPVHGKRLTAGRRGTSLPDKGRDTLTIAQVALASMVLLCASLLFQSFLRLQAVNPGFDPDILWTTRIDASARGTADWQRAGLLRQITASLERVPGVAAVGATNVAPFSGSGTANRYRLDGESAGGDFRTAAWRAVTPGFFRAVNLPLRRGRLFTDADQDGSLQVLIVSESMARTLWPNEDPVGKRLLWGSSGSPKTVIGVVGDMRDLSVDAAPVPTMFRPFAQLSDAPMTLLIRVQGRSSGTGTAIRQAIWSVDANIPVQVETVRRTMADSLLPERGALQVMAIFGLISIAIAGLGLYGLMSYRVTQRSLEIGIRLALGASPRAVRWDVQKRSVLLVSLGLLIGLPAAYACARLITSLLYQTRPAEWSVYAGVCVLFSMVALAASYGPASRAARVEPATILRRE